MNDFKGNIVYQIITDRMVAALEKGTVPWQQPWVGGHGPANLVSGKPYRGVNIFLLQLEAMAKGYSSPYWMTFDQMVDLGGTLKVVPEDQREPGDKSKSGQHPTMIVWWNMVKDRKSDDPDAKIPMLRYYRVFNLDQINDDIRIPKGREIVSEFEELEPNEAAEAILARYVPSLSGGFREAGDVAYYDQVADLVNLPPRETFVTADAFYDAVFHELSHSTGHKSRLNRPTLTTAAKFGSHEYGREELVAQMAATFLVSESGIESTFDNSAAYLGSWIRKIKEDPKAIVWAAGQAQAAADLILGRVSDAGKGAGNETALVSVDS